MKQKMRVPLQTLLIVLILATTQIGYVTAEKPDAEQGGKAVAERIPPSARFDLKDITQTERGRISDFDTGCRPELNPKDKQASNKVTHINSLAALTVRGG